MFQFLSRGTGDGTGRNPPMVQQHRSASSGGGCGAGNPLSCMFTTGDASGGGDDGDGGSSVVGLVCEDSLRSWCAAHGLDDRQRSTLEALGATTYLDFIEMKESDKKSLLQGLHLELVQKNKVMAALDPEALALFFECTDKRLSVDEYRVMSNKRLVRKVNAARSETVPLLSRSSLSCSSDSGIVSGGKKAHAHAHAHAQASSSWWCPPTIHIAPHKVVVVDRERAMSDDPTLTEDDFVSFQNLPTAAAADRGDGNGGLKVVLVAGKAGSGKTSTINSFVNYLFGINHADKFRLKLFSDGQLNSKTGGSCNDRRSSSKPPRRPTCTSRTDQVIGYLIESPPALSGGKGGSSDDSILIVDAPGFMDGRGTAHNDRVVEGIRQFFQAAASSASKIDYVNAVWFVNRSNDFDSGNGSRQQVMTVSHKWMFETILSLFSGTKDDDAASLLFTYCDGEEPPALEGISNAGLFFDNYFKINNAGFTLKDSSKGDPPSSSSKGSHYNTTLNRAFWDMSTSSFESLVRLLQQSENCAFLSGEKGTTALTNREQLSHSVEHAWREVEEAVCKLISLEQTIPLIVKARSRIEKNKFEVETLKYLRVRTRKADAGTYSIICDSCQCTCYDKCEVAGEGGGPPVIRPEALGGYYCKKCPVGCRWSSHRYVEHTWDLKEYKLHRNVKEMKQKYVRKSSDTTEFEQILDGLRSDFNKTQIELYDLVKRVQDITREMEEGALPPDAFLTEYANMLSRQRDVKDRRKVWKWRAGVLESGSRYIADRVGGTRATLFDTTFDEKIKAMMIEVKDDMNASRGDSFCAESTMSSLTGPRTAHTK